MSPSEMNQLFSYAHLNEIPGIVLKPLPPNDSSTTAERTKRNENSRTPQIPLQESDIIRKLGRFPIPVP